MSCLRCSGLRLPLPITPPRQGGAAAAAKALSMHPSCDNLTQEGTSLVYELAGIQGCLHQHSAVAHPGGNVIPPPSQDLPQIGQKEFWGGIYR